MKEDMNSIYTIFRVNRTSRGETSRGDSPLVSTLRSFTIQPGETVESRVLNSGVYIVRTLDGQYTKKLSVK